MSEDDTTFKKLLEEYKKERNNQKELVGFIKNWLNSLKNAEKEGDLDVFSRHSILVLETILDKIAEIGVF